MFEGKKQLNIVTHVGEKEVNVNEDEALVGQLLYPELKKLLRAEECLQAQDVAKFEHLREYLWVELPTFSCKEPHSRTFRLQRLSFKYQHTEIQLRKGFSMSVDAKQQLGADELLELLSEQYYELEEPSLLSPLLHILMKAGVHMLQATYSATTCSV